MKKNIPLIILTIACIVVGIFLTVTTHKEEKITRCIAVHTPERPTDQQDIIGLSCPPIDTVRIGFIGLGSRGSEAVRRFTHQKGIEVKA